MVVASDCKQRLHIPVELHITTGFHVEGLSYRERQRKMVAIQCQISIGSNTLDCTDD